MERARAVHLSFISMETKLNPISQQFSSLSWKLVLLLALAPLPRRSSCWLNLILVISIFCCFLLLRLAIIEIKVHFFSSLYLELQITKEKRAENRERNRMER
jgi:hypothetical protein